GQELLLQRIKNGEGHLIQFTYTRMCEPGGHYSRSVSSYPFNSVALPMYLVTRLDKYGLAETTYSYYNALVHRKGKGFLGFSKVTEHGPESFSLQNTKGGLRDFNGSTRYDHKQHNYFGLNSTHSMMVLDSVVNVKGNERLNKKTITNQIVQQNTGTLQ